MADSKEERKRKKSMSNSKSQPASGALVAAVSRVVIPDGYATGYETDGPSNSAKRKPKLRKKPKVAPAKDPNESDDGYLSSNAKSKSSRFFRLGNKSKTNVPAEPVPSIPTEPVPTVPVAAPVFLPIAARFATTLDFNIPTASSSSLPSPAPSPPAPISISTDVPRASIESSPLYKSPTLSPTKRAAGIHFAPGSESSHGDHHTSTSSTGHSTTSSFFSKFSRTSSPTTSSSSHSNLPPISFPLTRGESVPIHTKPGSSSTSGPKRVPDPLSLSPHGQLVPGADASPLAESPFVLLTPSDPSAPLPTETNVQRSRSKFFATNKLGQRPHHLDIDTIQRNLTSELVDSPIPSPHLDPPVNTFSYYELPPPSPPPIGPLPSIPDSPGPQESAQQHLLAARVLPTSRSPSPLGGTPRRGKESPFPMRPVLPGNNSQGLGRMGLEARVNVPRYRELYTLGGSRAPSPNPMASDNLGRRRKDRHDVVIGVDVEEPSDDEAWGYGYENDDDTAEIQGVMDRFGRQHRTRLDDEPALGRSRSFEALHLPREISQALGTRRIGRASPTRYAYGPPQSEDESDDQSRYAEDGRSTLYTIDNNSLSAMTDAESRRSFMDQDKSERTRERFVKRIENMFDESGREKLPPRGVPPVPKLPQGVTTGGNFRRGAGYF